MKKEELSWKPLKRLYGLLELDRKDISYIYLYAIFSGIITLSLPLGIQAIIGLIAGGTMSNSLYILVGIVTLGNSDYRHLKNYAISSGGNLATKNFCAFRF